MGRKSTKENKTIYQTYREEAELTRAAAEASFITEDKIISLPLGRVAVYYSFLASYQLITNL